nr:putative ribonuclease H-like domain, reverse transcriptase zinc-binding domain-containing protein [Ipomoea batatas]
MVREFEDAHRRFMELLESESGCRLLMVGVGMDRGLENWVEGCFQRFTESELCHFIFILWGIWEVRNKKCWQRSSLNPREVVRLSLGYLRDWRWVGQQLPRDDLSNGERVVCLGSDRFYHGNRCGWEGGRCVT